MSGFEPANPLGWGPKDPVTSAQLNKLDQQLVKAVNGVDGAAYDGPLQFSDIELMPNGTGGVHGAGKIDITGRISTTKAVAASVVVAGRVQPSSVSKQTIDVFSTPVCTLDLTAFDHFTVELLDNSDQFATAVLPTLLFTTASADPDHEVKTGARFSITFVPVAGQKRGAQLGPNAWPASVRFRSQTDRLLDGTDANDLTIYEIVNRGTPQQPIFDVVSVVRGTRT